MKDRLLKFLNNFKDISLAILGIILASLKKVGLTVIGFIATHKIPSAVVSCVLALAIILSCIILGRPQGDNIPVFSSSLTTSSDSGDTSSATVSDTSSATDTSSSSTSSNTSSSTSSSSTSSSYTPNTVFKPNPNNTPDDNVFLDALKYTGYNVQKHRDLGLMWKYIPVNKKSSLGILSGIGYGGGSTGTEVTSNGLPDISRFKRTGLVCATYVSYVYFNYLPNVAGIDTSALTRPTDHKLSNTWYTAAQDWVNKGYSRYIKFKASGSHMGWLSFTPEEDIPIGSIICFTNSPNGKKCTHVGLYAGYADGLHHMIHIGNDNGPEFCQIHRMLYDPSEPQWPLAIITTPSIIRTSAALQVELTSNTGEALAGVNFSLKSLKNGSVINLGTTDINGKIIKEGLVYGEYELTQTVPEGYENATPTIKINLITANNSYNTVKITNTVKAPTTSSGTASSN